MRKSLHIGLIFLLLFSTMGVAVSKHYCGEMLQKVAFSTEDKHCCGQQDTPEDCCSNETDLVQTSDFQPVPLTLIPGFSPYVLYCISFSLVDFELEITKEHYLLASLHSPPIVEEGIFLLVESFRL